MTLRSFPVSGSSWISDPCVRGKTKNPFYMLMRMDLPKIEVLNGQYEIPGVVKAK
jgi:hypothetical protein